MHTSTFRSVLSRLDKRLYLADVSGASRGAYALLGLYRQGTGQANKMEGADTAESAILENPDEYLMPVSHPWVPEWTETVDGRIQARGWRSIGRLLVERCGYKKEAVVAAFASEGLGYVLDLHRHPEVPNAK
jgi:hypothetical protein